MIKAILKPKDKNKLDILFIGLSEMNFKKLKEGFPINFSFEGLSHDIVISYGKTEQSILNELKNSTDKA